MEHYINTRFSGQDKRNGWLWKVGQLDWSCALAHAKRCWLQREHFWNLTVYAKWIENLRTFNYRRRGPFDRKQFDIFLAFWMKHKDQILNGWKYAICEGGWGWVKFFNNSGSLKYGHCDWQECWCKPMYLLAACLDSPTLNRFTELDLSTSAYGAF